MRTKNKTGLTLFFITTILCLLLPVAANARVQGPCADCHTMHNSQDGSTYVTTAMDQLLKQDCVACHTNTVDNATIVNNTPIVLNTAGGPDTATMLAGGNFYWVSKLGGADDAMGHNVAGVSDADATLVNGAPGTIAGKGCADSCHTSLVTPIKDPEGQPGTGGYKNGCEGCHLKIGHHSPADNTLGAGDAFRFLASHEGWGIVPNGANGVWEDNDWEATKSNVDHNHYPGQADDTLTPNQMTVGRWCAGCHHAFHAFGTNGDPFFGTGLDNGGDRTQTPNDNPWLRHPTNVPLSGDNVGTDYEFLDLLDYDPLVPVARAIGDINKATLTEGSDQVFCLSCHRAHGSQYEDALRFNYAKMLAHNGTDSTEGCFYCHATKDT